jgi:hypothetical protein
MDDLKNLIHAQFWDYFYHQRKYKFLHWDVGKENVLIIFFFNFHETFTKIILQKLLLWKRYYEMNTIKTTRGMIMTYKSNINRFVKHTNKMLCNILNKEINVHGILDNWYKNIHHAMWLYNSHSNLFMGFTFFQLAYGVESTLPIEYKIMNFHMTK